MLSIEKQLKRFIVASLVLLVSVSTHAEDGLTPGPGLFSGESGEFSLSAMLAKKSADSRVDLNRVELKTTETANLDSATDSLAPSLPMETETGSVNFRTYREWRALREADPELYTDFNLYLDYKAFLRSQGKH